MTKQQPSEPWNCEQIFKRLEKVSNPAAIAGMERFGITPQRTFGVAIPHLRALAREIGKNHELANKLWSQNIRETRILASMIDNPKELTESQMENWVRDFDYWEICDQCIMNLFEKSPLAWKKAVEWSTRPEELARRAGFVLMARLAVSDKKASDDKFQPFLAQIAVGAADNRNFVKKAVNWALRQIGKRNLTLNQQAIQVSEQLLQTPHSSAHWIARDALKELKSMAVQERLNKNA